MKDSAGMVLGMASKKVTITLDETQLKRIHALVEPGATPSISGFVQYAVRITLDDVAGWDALLAEAWRETGGPLSYAERLGRRGPCPPREPDKFWGPAGAWMIDTDPCPVTRRAPNFSGLALGLGTGASLPTQISAN